MARNTTKLEVSKEKLEELIKEYNNLIKNPNLDKTNDLVLKMMKRVNNLSINKNEYLSDKIKTIYLFNQYAKSSIKLKLSLEAADNYEQGKQERLPILKPNELAAAVQRRKQAEKLQNKPISLLDVVKKGTEQAKQAKQGEGKISIKVHRLI